GIGQDAAAQDRRRIMGKLLSHRSSLSSTCLLNSAGSPRRPSQPNLQNDGSQRGSSSREAALLEASLEAASRGASTATLRAPTSMTASSLLTPSSAPGTSSIVSPSSPAAGALAAALAPAVAAAARASVSAIVRRGLAREVIAEGRTGGAPSSTARSSSE